jgi:hypothetical protein
MSTNLLLKPALECLLLAIFISATSASPGQSVAVNAPGLAARDRTAFTTSSKLAVLNKARYVVGETPNIAIAKTNNSRSPQMVKEAEYENFSLEMTGLFDSDSELKRKTGVYYGRWDLPKESTRSPLPGESHLWLALKMREPTFVKLAPGESTTVELNLAKTFGSYLGVGKYKLTVKSKAGQRIVKEFEVFFDDEKSVPLLAGMLKSDDVGERNWARVNLVQFQRPKLVALLEEMVKAGNEKQREFASESITNLKAGWFDYLQLRVGIKDRYSRGEPQIVAISIMNGSRIVQLVKAAEDQKFSLALIEVFGDGTRQEKKTCVYHRSQNNPPKTINLAELESTSLTLNLSECLALHLDAGEYELVVKGVDAQESFKVQIVVKKFAVY